MSVRSLLLVLLFWLFLNLFTGCQPTVSNVPSNEIPQHTADAQTSNTKQAPAESDASLSVQLRQAIAYCSDRAALIRAVYPWIGETEPLEAYSFLQPGHWANTDVDKETARYPFSPEKGMALLDSLGWIHSIGAQYRTNAKGEPLTLTLTTTEAKSRLAWTSVWEEQMKTCGIRIVRRFEAAEWLFGAKTGLSHRDFELSAFPASSADEWSLLNSFSCDQIPNARNEWHGQNFSGWCNSTVQEAVKELAGTLALTERQAWFQTIQREFSNDLPILPLFYRLDEVFAINPALENFVPPEDGIHTWNAADWNIPGKDTIIIGTDGEPVSLSESSYIAEVIRSLIYGKDVVRINGILRPVFLSQVPSLENGTVVANTKLVKEGDTVFDYGGNPVILAPGVVVRNDSGEIIQYNSVDVAMRQWVVDYKFQPGLTWSDGVPVTQADYELGYRVYCSAMNHSNNPACKTISEVVFISDTHYQVHWLPGYNGTSIGMTLLPPIPRYPAHQILTDGRKMSEVPTEDLPSLQEISRAPLSIGPYIMKEWINHKGMTLVANPYYSLSSVTTPTILIHFLEHNQAIAELQKGNVDILDWETITSNDIADHQLAPAQQEGIIRLILKPSSVWEQITFNIID